jgi:hypothetical protein
MVEELGTAFGIAKTPLRLKTPEALRGMCLFLLRRLDLWTANDYIRVILVVRKRTKLMERSLYYLAYGLIFGLICKFAFGL